MLGGAGKFEPQIHHIRFPNFRNLDSSVNIEFEYPITAIVGANGTNKTSILRAIQGCPDQMNIGRYWFGTALDQIPDNERNQFVYGRWSDTADAVVEMLKMRVRRKNSRTGEVDPDYFEPSQPTELAGMELLEEVPPGGTMPHDRTSDRWKLIQKSVRYIDFRSEISAYDKYFFHHDYERRPKDVGGPRVDQLRRRKELVRDNSKKLLNIFEQKRTSYKQGKREWVVEAPRFLSSGELQDVGMILGRDYDSVEIVTHRAFRVTGVTARMCTGSLNYSEAWAGSGEFAVVQLVTAVRTSPDRSLIILDEPEVSLHPGAQRRLMQFIERESLRRKLQVVFATHSPAMIENLPACAIKVLSVDPNTNRVMLRSQHSSSHEAFQALQHGFDKKTIVVEDNLAAEIVKRAIRIERPERVNAVDIVHYPGGEKDLRSRDLVAWSRHSETNVLLLLDGDAYFETPNVESIPMDKLEMVCANIVGGSKVVKGLSSGSSGSKSGNIVNIIGWAHEHVRFLPGGQPEFWLHQKREGLQVSSTGDSKWRWADAATEELGLGPMEHGANSSQILNLQLRALVAISDDDQDLVAISGIVSEFLER